MTVDPTRTRGASSPSFDPVKLLDRAAELGITSVTDKTDMKERIMIAYEHGLLAPFETRVLVMALGLEAA
ncbi:MULTISPECIES: hypothetical protein [unclassified Novosphingobium]|uniref:hypothetical protein n=1 Tax=unclassified Novosphingobium TaxID=2644732 RepID=UPI00135976BC|nr:MULTISPECIES: hypothetical protein [unclassified Novosphingobium]